MPKKIIIVRKKTIKTPRLALETRQRLFKRKAGRILKKKAKENMKEWLAELEN